GQARSVQARTVKCYNCNGTGHIARNCTQPKRPQNSEYFKDKMLLMQAQENGVALDAEQLLFLAGGPDNAFDDDVDEQPVQDLALNVENVFQAEDYDAFDSDIDEAPTAQTMFMANLSTLALLTQSYRTFLPQTNNQLRTSPNPRNQATVQDGRVVVQNVQGRPNRGQGMNPWGGNAAGYGEAQNRVGNVNQGQARPGKARTVKCYNCNGGPDNAFDDDVD
nr:retrovirus-related Pol polyprotein from transposon TNT 1-94 [Tanacetum cinerariifolium]